MRTNDKGACPFCTIGESGSAPGLLYHDDKLFVLLDRESLAFGHCMVIPREHIGTVYKLSGASRDDFFRFAAEVAAQLELALRVKAVGMVSFGTGLAHAHLHLVPHDDPDVLLHPTRYARERTGEELTVDAKALRDQVHFGEKPARATDGRLRRQAADPQDF